jgi:hypothetical protein
VSDNRWGLGMNPPAADGGAHPPLMPFAVRTGTVRNLDALRARGWGLLVSAAGEHRAEGFQTYAIDNGAWSAYTSGEPWNPGPFEQLITELGGGSSFVVVPDIVAGGLASLRLSESWLPRLKGVGGRRLIPVQDGMTPADVRPLIGSDVGIFVGGSTDWKIATMGRWGALARERGSYCHVGRVNTVRRIRLCLLAGVDSFDGSSVSRFSINLPRLDNARRQTAFAFVDGPHPKEPPPRG